MINKKKFTKAYNILKQHNLPISTQSGLEAEWLAGWISFTHLKIMNKQVNTLRGFSIILIIILDQNQHIGLPLVNIEKNSKNSIINNWLKESSKNKFSFYGQNAALKLEKFNFKEKSIVKKEPTQYKDLFETVDIIIKSKQKSKKIYPFFEKIFELCSIDEEKYFVLERAYNLSDKSIVGKLSKKLKKPSLKYSYPEIKEFVPNKFKNSLHTLALIQAIVHQESNFSISAYSSAGARGLMQLMPFTAKKVARDLKIKYYKNRLTRNPQYNILLGTTYINEMLIKFKNSLPLSISCL